MNKLIRKCQDASGGALTKRNNLLDRQRNLVQTMSSDYYRQSPNSLFVALVANPEVKIGEDDHGLIAFTMNAFTDDPANSRAHSNFHLIYIPNAKLDGTPRKLSRDFIYRNLDDETPHNFAHAVGNLNASDVGLDKLFFNSEGDSESYRTPGSKEFSTHNYGPVQKDSAIPAFLEKNQGHYVYSGGSNEEGYKHSQLKGDLGHLYYLKLFQEGKINKLQLEAAVDKLYLLDLSLRNNAYYDKAFSTGWPRLSKALSYAGIKGHDVKNALGGIASIVDGYEMTGAAVDAVKGKPYAGKRLKSLAISAAENTTNGFTNNPLNVPVQVTKAAYNLASKGVRKIAPESVKSLYRLLRHAVGDKLRSAGFNPSRWRENVANWTGIHFQNGGKLNYKYF